MSRYFFNLHECSGAIGNDATGLECADMDSVRAAAVEKARNVIAHEVQHGRLCLSCWIVVADDRGQNVLTFQFGDAVTFTNHAACGPASS